MGRGSLKLGGPTNKIIGVRFFHYGVSRIKDEGEL
jgi:hypothetical protein